MVASCTSILCGDSKGTVCDTEHLSIMLFVLRVVSFRSVYSKCAFSTNIS
jgi:hypothetical protein